jgi:hypothetical protein
MAIEIYCITVEIRKTTTVPSIACKSFKLRTNLSSNIIDRKYMIIKIISEFDVLGIMITGSMFATEFAKENAKSRVHRTFLLNKRSTKAPSITHCKNNAEKDKSKGYKSSINNPQNRKITIQ